MSQGGALNLAGVPGAVITLTGNSGGAVSSVANNINTVGAGSITVVGNPSTHTLTTQLAGLQGFSLLAGQNASTIHSIGVATNGQLPIGATGSYPALATLTAGNGISIANGSGSITISVLNYAAGTWTPTVSGTGGAGATTYDTQMGNYTQIGNRIYMDCLLGWSGTSATGNLLVAGLPVTCATSLCYANCIVTSALGSGNTAAYVESIGSSAELAVNVIAAASGTTAAFPVPNASIIFFSMVYQV